MKFVELHVTNSKGGVSYRVKERLTMKNFVLDTNVVLHDPQAITKFGDNTVVIPMYVVEEVDNFKKQLNELGRAARQFSRTLDDFRKEGNLAHGVAMPNGGKIRVLAADRKYNSDLYKTI